jgi:hypothetical protein
VSTDIEGEVRAAFDAASADIVPPADLAHRVRRAARRHRWTAAMAVGLAVAAVAAGTAYLADVAAQVHRPPPHTAGGQRPLPPADRPSLTIPVPYGAGVEALAAAGPYLYLATDHAGNPPYVLAAYDRLTGRLIRRVSVPAMPEALRTGPGGSVWLTFSPDQGGGPPGIWLLSPDLGRHSALFRYGPPDIVPTGSDTAVAATSPGLTIVRMPPPGMRGHATAYPDGAGAIGRKWAVSALAAVNGRMAAQVTDGYGMHSHLVIAGDPRLSYGGAASQQVGFITAQDNGLWATTSSDSAPNVGPLIRLSPALRLITPAGVRTNPIFRRSEQVWSHGDAVWVGSASPGHHLVCFTYRGRMGPVATIGLHGQPSALAIAGNTVYVSLASAVVGITSDVFGYTVPASCR